MVLISRYMPNDVPGWDHWLFVVGKYLLVLGLRGFVFLRMISAAIKKPFHFGKVLSIWGGFQGV